MSTTNAKRKRARKACIPCHQRKRKCDTVYPCGMCTTYGYNCSYTNDASHGSTPPPTQRVSLNNNELGLEHSLSNASPSHIERDRRKGDDSSTKSPAVLSGASASVGAGTSPGIFDEQKFRYSGASAAMAFPHILGVALGSDAPPKTRSFAYNFGIRPEEASNAHVFLGNIISDEDLSFFSGVYFSVLSPVTDVMDARFYTQRCRDYFHSPGSNANGIAFAAVAAGIAALGSFLSPNRHPRESDLVQYAKAILDDPASMRLHGIDHIVAWGMRVLYLRATTRPSNAWIASCTQMHLCEALGLHEEETIKKIASLAGAALLGHDADRLRRIFWCSWAGHVMLSYEYDRSPVAFRSVTCQPIISVPGSITDQFVRLIQIIPSPNSPLHLELPPSPSPGEELFSRLKALDTLTYTHPFLIVTKAEIAFCFYRRLYHLKTHIPDSIIRLIITAGNAAVAAAEQQVSQGRLFWNVIGSVFQYTCILLSMDCPAASPQIGGAFKGLENIVRAADTVLTREALSVARHLLSLNIAKRRRELAQLEAVEAGYEFLLEEAPQLSVPVSGSEADVGSMPAVPDDGWNLDWDQFFIEPYFPLFGGDVQF
ncbi:Putative C6 zinc finger domain protein [Aspergillus calidoustus]|uniref:Putative C6 zinc finger domain protein n=1 Tax=Aspergillus calidoustus TaxID=454130 RepID=A0A0U5GJR2_ASPCI|nr:Putative C6 zinc finger domain protein [Aspergillus calidoustus]